MYEENHLFRGGKEKNRVFLLDITLTGATINVHPGPPSRIRLIICRVLPSPISSARMPPFANTGGVVALWEFSESALIFLEGWSTRTRFRSRSHYSRDTLISVTELMLAIADVGYPQQRKSIASITNLISVIDISKCLKRTEPLTKDQYFLALTSSAWLTTSLGLAESVASVQMVSMSKASWFSEQTNISFGDCLE